MENGGKPASQGRDTKRPFGLTDAQEFASVFERFRPALVRHCTRVLKDSHAAEDVVQETYIRVLCRLDRFDRSRPAFPWLLTIAHRLALNYLRSTKAHPLGGNGAWLEDVRDISATGSEDPFEAVAAREEREFIIQAVRALPPRQRRVLLQSVDGKRYADIAASEGISLGATKLVAFRARESLRKACRDRRVAIVLIPFSATRARLSAIRARGRRLLTESRVHFRKSAEPIFEVLGGSITHGIAAFAVTLAALASDGVVVARQGGPSQPESASLSEAAALEVEHSAATRVVSPAVVRREGERSEQATLRELLRPTAPPEDTTFTSIAVSPNYEHDRTLIAAGSAACPIVICPVLFISRDGGATWERRVPKAFHGQTIVLPPAYPRDPRIYAMGPTGLEVSHDHGHSFRPASPVQGEMAMSPLFDRGDPRILIASALVTEYRADTRVTKPAGFIGPAGQWMTVAFSPAYLSDRTVFVTAAEWSGTTRPSVSRCVRTICRAVGFRDVEELGIRVSPGFVDDQTVYAFGGGRIFRSTDGGDTYATLPGSVSLDEPIIWDLLVAPDGKLFAAIVEAAGGFVIRSTDGGGTWTRHAIRLQGFELGPNYLALTPDNRLIALGSFGIACSVDSGSTWRSRCPR